jgi:CO dehydrogenase/acetyl-CoA synthase beta subunit
MAFSSEEGVLMAGKIQLKLKPKAPAAAAPAAAPAAGAAAPAFSMPAGGSAGGIKLVLKDAKITIDKVVLAK